MNERTQPAMPGKEERPPEVDLERCWYRPIESGLSGEQITDTASCCHGILRQAGGSSSGTSLGAMRSCRQCGFIL